MRSNKGFTFIECCVVLMIITILFNIALPNFIRMKHQAHAARIVQDFLTIRNAAFMCYAETGEFPRDRGTGKIPPEIKEYLPKNFSFDLRPKLDVRYDWENWVKKSGKPKHQKTGVLVGISINTKDKRLVTALQGAYNGPFHYTLGNKYTFMILPIQG